MRFGINAFDPSLLTLYNVSRHASSRSKRWYDASSRRAAKVRVPVPSHRTEASVVLAIEAEATLTVDEVVTYRFAPPSSAELPLKDE
eukprot:CAMPEP_0197394284 /NCGR_PEP_ID=MMETSP1165-20131217/4793_1 /TAXON_ID=284809 /ORGANISM="Chrysocystis fragilis, Strain CCMP3189" /LENGTH=86 /DNA_ID=CAMNT_0042919971 /DNA_START=72 /DNA_END=329 /DNA_ORIENTATION=-